MPMTPDNLIRTLMPQRVKLLAFVAAIVGDRHLAEDTVQEVFARAVAKADEINDAEHAVRWARSAARLVAIEQLRAHRRQPMIFDDAVLDAIESRWDQLSAAVSPDLAEALESCVANLSPYARRLIETRYGRGLTGHALADAMQRKHGTVYVALSRIHQTLNHCIRQRLAEMDQAGGISGGCSDA